MTETILVVGSKPIDEKTVIWDLLKADYQVRYTASVSSAIRIAGPIVLLQPRAPPFEPRTSEYSL
jgi:hypothetical protein